MCCGNYFYSSHLLVMVLGGVNGLGVVVAVAINFRWSHVNLLCKYGVGTSAIDEGHSLWHDVCPEIGNWNITHVLRSHCTVCWKWAIPKF